MMPETYTSQDQPADASEEPSPAPEQEIPTGKPEPQEASSEADEADSPYCLNCHINLKDTTENPNSVLCGECREHYIRYPLPRWLLAVLIIIIFAMAAGVLKMPVVLCNFKLYQQAEAAYDQKRFNTAAASYALLQEQYPKGQTIHEKMFLALVKAQRMEEAALVFNTYLDGKNGQEDTVDEINSYLELLNGYYLTLDKIQAATGGEIISEDLPSSYAKLESLLNDAECLRPVILYCLAQINFQQGKTGEAVNQIKEAYAAESRLTFIYSLLGNMQRRLKNYDAARAVYQELLQKNQDDVEAYRGMGVISLLQGDLTAGLTSIEHAYTIDPHGLYVADAQVVALYANGRRDEAQALYDQIKTSEGYEVDPVLESYLAGKATLENLYLDMDN